VKIPPRLEDEVGALEAGFGDIFEWVFGADGEADAFEERGGDRSQDAEWQRFESDQFSVFGWQRGEGGLEE
jgi:hypothetical protein